ncbi:hypothetical protein [Dyella sp. OK004]|nr:hypothetical protein [Dyella sp. OK004]
MTSRIASLRLTDTVPAMRVVAVANGLNNNANNNPRIDGWAGV